MKAPQTTLMISKKKEIKNSMNNLMSSKEIRNKMVAQLENNMIRIVT